MTTPAPRAATLQDVAREAGVSLATASRVLNGSTRKVAEAYRERVEAAADALGYAANMSAQATARGTSSTLALLVADIADPYFAQIASGVAHAAADEGLVLTIGITEREAAQEAQFVRSLRGQRPRGVVLAASRSSAGASEALTAVLNEVEQMGGTVVSLGAPSGTPGGRMIAVQNREGSRMLGAALAQRGYSSAIALGAAEGLVTSDQRLGGFAEGFTGDVAVRRDGFDRESGYRAMSDALAAGVPGGTVVFGITDMVALGAIAAIRDAGRSVGDDIAVAGFGDVFPDIEVALSMTTVRAPLRDLGEQAVAAVVADDWSDADPLGVEVLLRGSTPGR
ncbi:LacI family DNA-binding transcriptional regulator [Microbacterium halophytorum]|uniref:LacI family DNA-binding transcriptional regulator n=1 Tax=Microbacterium halophytorum TaxID=2067568 RepID=UPI001E5732A4|nr:LacI family DNA-binding transcriptional regulator [Microbacterium halophytorum]